MESVNGALASVLDRLPADWRDEFDATGQRSWSALAALARIRSTRLGIPFDTWETALTHLGPRDVVLLTLAAEADAIRCPAAWMRAMASRAAREPLDLSRNLLAPRREPSRLPDQRTDSCASFSA